MEAELERYLQNADQKQLLILIQELALRHPVLQDEMTHLLRTMHVETEPDSENGLTEQVTEDWDFSGDEVMTLRTPSLPLLNSFDLAMYQQRIASYHERVQQGTTEISADLNDILREAEQRANAYDYHNALDLYALVIDTLLHEEQPDLLHVFHSAITEAIPVLETLLSGASSNIIIDKSMALSPLLTLELRQQWLQRLFQLWLKRLDLYHTDNEVPDILHYVAWSDDMPMLRKITKDELQRVQSQQHNEIIDLSLQYRTRALDKFLRDLPMS